MTETVEYPKHVFAQAPVGQTVTVYSLKQENAVRSGSAKFTKIESATGPVYTIVLPEEEK